LQSDKKSRPARADSFGPVRPALIRSTPCRRIGNGTQSLAYLPSAACRNADAGLGPPFALVVSQCFLAGQPATTTVAAGHHFRTRTHGFTAAARALRSWRNVKPPPNVELFDRRSAPLFAELIAWRVGFSRTQPRKAECAHSRRRRITASAFRDIGVPCGNVEIAPRGCSLTSSLLPPSAVRLAKRRCPRCSRADRSACLRGRHRLTRLTSGPSRNSCRSTFLGRRRQGTIPCRSTTKLFRAVSLKILKMTVKRAIKAASRQSFLGRPPLHSEAYCAQRTQRPRQLLLPSLRWQADQLLGRCRD
jgi:hypothetical protein